MKVPVALGHEYSGIVEALGEGVIQVVTLITLCGLTHKDSYLDVGLMMPIKFVTGLLGILLYGMFGEF